MAYMNQEKKAAIAAALKEVVPVGWKYSLAVRHHSAIVMTILAAPVDLIDEANKRDRRIAERRGEPPSVITGNYEVNPHSLRPETTPSDEALAAILAVLNIGNYNKSDVMIDYHDVGHYVELHVGRWDKPFQHTNEKQKTFLKSDHDCSPGL